MRRAERVMILMSGFCLSLAGAASAFAVDPGVDIAAPRVAITTADGATLRFVPANVVVEQGDYVRWNWTAGLHTTTSGVPCVADMLWSSPLNASTTQFTRQFLEVPSVRRFFCSPHCGLGMTGQVTVSDVIQLTVTDAGGATQLAWAGGGGLYRVFRSDSPLFGTSTVLTAAGGTNQTSFLDQTGGSPAMGRAFFYLVMNQF